MYRSIEKSYKVIKERGDKLHTYVWIFIFPFFSTFVFYYLIFYGEVTEYPRPFIYLMSSTMSCTLVLLIFYFFHGL